MAAPASPLAIDPTWPAVGGAAAACCCFGFCCVYLRRRRKRLTLAVLFHSGAPEGAAACFSRALVAAGGARGGPLQDWHVWAAPADVAVAVAEGADSHSAHLAAADPAQRARDVAAADAVLLVCGLDHDELAAPHFEQRLAVYALSDAALARGSGSGGALWAERCGVVVGGGARAAMAARC